MLYMLLMGTANVGYYRGLLRAESGELLLAAAQETDGVNWNPTWIYREVSVLERVAVGVNLPAVFVAGIPFAWQTGNWPWEFWSHIVAVPVIPILWYFVGLAFDHRLGFRDWPPPNRSLAASVLRYLVVAVSAGWIMFAGAAIVYGLITELLHRREILVPWTDLPATAAMFLWPGLVCSLALSNARRARATT